MGELRPVAGPSSPVQRHVRRLIIVVVLGLLVAIVKPWGTGIGPSTASVPLPVLSPAPTPIATPTPAPVAGTYDFLAFGTNEPPPGWELWPAGRLASFSFAMRIDMATPIAVGEPAPSGAATTPTPEPRDTPLGTPSAAGVPAIWPAIRIPHGSVLDLVGINQPLGYVVHVMGLTRVEDDGSLTPVRALLGTSPWPTHFTTFGYAPKATEDSMAPWPAGHYRLELTIDPGAVSRTLDIIVEGLANETAPGASSTPSPGAGATP
jgi:hypothetical protein